MVDLTTTPPDPGAVTVHPQLGVSNADASRAIPRAASDLADIGAAFFENRRENRDARTLAGFILDQVTTKRDNAREILSKSLQIPDLSEKDVDDLSAAATQVKKLDVKRLQRPGRATDAFERIEGLRVSVAANPRLAVQMLQMFEATGGQSPGADLSDVIETAEQAQADFIKNVNDTSFVMGLPLELPFEYRADRVEARQSLENRSIESAQTLQILQNKGATTRIQRLNEYSQSLIPAATLDISTLLRTQIRGLSVGERVSPDVRKDILFETNQRIAEITAQLVQFGGPDITEADIATRLITINALKDQVTVWADGSGDLEMLTNSVKMAEMVAMNNIYAKHPELADAAALVTAFMRNNPLAGTLFGVSFLEKYHPIMESALASIVDGYNVHSVLSTKNLTLEEQIQAFDMVGVTLRSVAGQADVDGVTFGKFLASVFREYRANPENPNLTRFLNQMMDDLASPEVVQRLTDPETLIRAEDKANILTGLEFYVTDFFEDTITKMKDVLGARAPSQSPRGKLARLELPIFEELVETSVGEDEIPVFFAKDRTDSRIAQRVQELNRRGKKLGEVSRVFAALGLDNLNRTAQEITTEMLITGELPSPTDRAPEVIEQPQNVELQIVRSPREIRSIALGMESPEDRVEFLQNQGVELPFEASGFVITKDGHKLKVQSN